ncbi:FAD-dependent oxidoreductase [Nocardia brasiliensis]|uniref:FAD-dependent oxidoreductase n=1 Tax=Nocardia brasiliensis TaxID=37326 RepID=UPI002458AC74|nr:FAD-dependent oxidoreductase [Nocardia brasiliensis]
MKKPTVAVVGSGVSGLSAAYALREQFDVTIFEAERRLGGHADTYNLQVGDSQKVPVDIAFIGFRRASYPALHRMFEELRVSSRDVTARFRILCGGCGYMNDISGSITLPSKRPETVLPDIWKQVEVDVARMTTDLQSLPSNNTALTLGDLLESGGYSEYFSEHFLIPPAATWFSIPGPDTRGMPIHFLVNTMGRHGLIGSDADGWQIVEGGSRTYVDRIANALPDIRLATPVQTIIPTTAGVDIVHRSGHLEHFDKAVVATHADEALRLLDNPSSTQQNILGAFRYSNNPVTLHTDSRILGNAPDRSIPVYFHRSGCGTNAATSVNINLNAIYEIDNETDFIVTTGTGGNELISPDTIVARRHYRHLLHTAESYAAQHCTDKLSSGHLAFAGSYLSGGALHEDGCVSGARAAARISESQPHQP